MDYLQTSTIKLRCHTFPDEFPQHGSRRRFFKDCFDTAAVCAVAGTILPRLATATDLGGTASAKNPDYIDAHVHIWTPNLKKYPLVKGYRQEDMKPCSFTPQQLFDHAKPCGVTRVVLIQMSFYGFDNSYMLDMISQHPGVFVGVAVIDDHANRPQDEMRRLKPQGIAGFRLDTRHRDANEWFATPGIKAMWQCGAEERLSMCMLCDVDAIPAINRMCEQYPEAPVVIDHMARIGVNGMILDRDIDQLCQLGKKEQVYVKVSAFYALGKKHSPYLDLSPMIRRLRDAFGAQRLMWASDCPFQVDPGHNYRDSIDLIRDHLDILAKDEKELLLRKTAEQFYFAT